MSDSYNDNQNRSTGADDTLDDFTRLKRWVIQGHRRRSKFREEAIRAFDFVANHQWSDEDMKTLDDQHRPAVTFNRSAPLIDAVCGLEVNNRQTVAYLPRTMDNVGIDEARTNVVKWIRDECFAEDEESQAFRSLAIAGEGWTETRMDYGVDPKGKVVEEFIDCLEMGTNSGSQRANYMDARMIYRVRLMEKEDAKAMFDDDYNEEALHADWMNEGIIPTDGGEGNKVDYPTHTRAAVESELGGRRKIKIVQVQWWDLEPYVMVAEDGNPDLQELSPEDFATYQQRVAQMQQMDQANLANHVAATQVHSAQMVAHGQAITAGAIDPLTAPPAGPGPAPQPTAPSYKHVDVKKRCYYQAFLGKGLLQKEKMAIQGFQFKCMTGKWDRRDRIFYGMLRDMFDPQMWANKWLSQTMHIMNTNAKGGIMAETDAFVNVKKAEDEWADNTKIIWTKPGAISGNKIKERMAPPLPTGLGELMQFALSSLRDVTGVNLELLGQADREQAASLETQRRQAAMTILATLFDALRRYRKDQGRLLLQFSDLLPAGTLARILEKGQWKYIPMVKDRTSEEYDVIFDETPSTPDQKQAIWQMTLSLLQSGVQFPPQVVITLLKYSPYPESVVAEISKSMGMDGTIPPEVLAEKLKQAEAALQVTGDQLVQAKKEADTAQQEVEVKGAKAAIDAYEASTARLQVLLTAIAAKLGLDQEAAVFAIEKMVPDPTIPQAAGTGENAAPPQPGSDPEDQAGMIHTAAAALANGPQQ